MEHVLLSEYNSFYGEKEPNICKVQLLLFPFFDSSLSSLHPPLGIRLSCPSEHHWVSSILNISPALQCKLDCWESEMLLVHLGKLQYEPFFIVLWNRSHTKKRLPAVKLRCCYRDWGIYCSSGSLIRTGWHFLIKRRKQNAVEGFSHWIFLLIPVWFWQYFS